MGLGRRRCGPESLERSLCTWSPWPRTRCPGIERAAPRREWMTTSASPWPGHPSRGPSSGWRASRRRD